MPERPLLQRRRAAADHPALPLLTRSINEPELFEAFYIALSRRVLVFFVQRVVDPTTAWDLLGETFAYALERRHQFRGVSDAEAEGWLFAVARSQLSHYYRKGAVEQHAYRRLGLQEVSIPDATIERIERLVDLSAQRQLIAEAKGELPPEQAWAVEQRVVHERTYEELARELGVAEQVVRTRVSRGLKRLRLVLETRSPGVFP
jgi:RNA polymerase sigma factor (sigma-70 family)